MDNLRPQVTDFCKQTIVNLGEEYLPSKFFSCLRLAKLRFLQSARAEVAFLEDFSGLETAL
ncbi:unnamed protein product [Prunus armeniaca]